MDKIISLQNEKIKKIIKLRKARTRKREDVIIIEGQKEIELAHASGLEFLEFYFSPMRHQKSELEINADLIAEVSPEVFSKISYRDNPDGYLALARPRYWKLEEIKLKKNPLLFVLEKVEKPGNLGALLRTADAAGVELVILNETQTDLYNPNVIRASRGTIFTVPTIILSVAEAQEFLAKNKIRSVATTGQAKKNYTANDFAKPTAIVLGAEDRGLSKGWLDSADELIKIPMQGKIDSLNVSVAGAVIVYEAIRQRSVKK